MSSSFRHLRQEFAPMFSLAVPVVLAELGWMTMGLVDILMVGPIGPEAIGAVGIGSRSSWPSASSRWGCSSGSTRWSRRPSARAVSTNVTGGSLTASS